MNIKLYAENVLMKKIIKILYKIYKNGNTTIKKERS